jgi:hypothetical protein
LGNEIKGLVERAWCYSDRQTNKYTRDTDLHTALEINKEDMSAEDLESLESELEELLV